MHTETLEGSTRRSNIEAFIERNVRARPFESSRAANIVIHASCNCLIKFLFHNELNLNWGLWGRFSTSEFFQGVVLWPQQIDSQ